MFGPGAKDALRGFAASAQQFAAAAAAKGSKALDAARDAGKHVAAASSDAVKHAGAALSSNPAMAAVGTEVSVGGRHLVIESLLAEGGFASVYLANNRPELGGGGPGGGGAGGGGGGLGAGGAPVERFVLKKMFAGGPEAIAQLSAEVKLMERLSHPNIVRVLGSDVKRARAGDGLDITVLMEFCPGGHLLARINKLAEACTPLPPAKLLDVFASIVRPVVYLHSLSPPMAHRCGAVRWHGEWASSRGYLWRRSSLF